MRYFPTWINKGTPVLLTCVGQEGDSRCQRRDPAQGVALPHLEEHKVEEEGAGAFHEGSMGQGGVDGGAALGRDQVLDEVELCQLPGPVEAGDSPACPCTHSLGQQLGPCACQAGLQEQELLQGHRGVGGGSVGRGAVGSGEEEEQGQDHVQAKATTPGANLHQHPQLQAARAPLE